MHLAPATEPGVLVRELLWYHELPEAVINGDFVVLGLHVLALPLQSLLWKSLHVVLGADQVFIEGPAFLGIELNLELEFKISMLFLRRSMRLLLLFVDFVRISDKRLMLLIFIVKV